MIDDALARGFRRDSAREILARLPHLDLDNLPSRFSSRAKEIDKRIKRIYPPERVQTVAVEKKGYLCWVAVPHRFDGHELLIQYSMLRNFADNACRAQLMPIVSTPHFVERLIQSCGDKHVSLVLCMARVLGELKPSLSIAHNSINWTEVGKLWVALEDFLIIGEMAHTLVTLKTILREDTLAPPKRGIWLRLTDAARKYEVVPQ